MDGRFLKVDFILFFSIENCVTKGYKFTENVDILLNRKCIIPFGNTMEEIAVVCWNSTTHSVSTPVTVIKRILS